MLHLMNSAMIPDTSFIYLPKEISIGQAKNIFERNQDNFSSNISYLDTCKMLNILFKTNKIYLNRDLTKLKAGDFILAFPLKYRVPNEFKKMRSEEKRDIQNYKIILIMIYPKKLYKIVEDGII